MDNKSMRGAIIRGAMTMQTPLIIVFFKECCSDDLNANWNDLTSAVQEFWIQLAEQLESVMRTETWGSTIEVSELKVKSTPKCLCITHNNERYFHPQCTTFHNTKAVGYVGGIPYKTQLFQGTWPHETLVETYDDRCPQCKEFDNDGCPSCGPNTIRKVFDPTED